MWIKAGKRFGIENVRFFKVNLARPFPAETKTSFPLEGFKEAIEAFDQDSEVEMGIALKLGGEISEGEEILFHSFLDLWLSPYLAESIKESTNKTQEDEEADDFVEPTGSIAMSSEGRHVLIVHIST
jgi:hypothetical protein